MPTKKPDTRQAIVVGAGSIGVRHKHVLEDLGFNVGIVSRRRNVGEFKTMGEAVESSNPSYVVLATETERHLESLVDLIASGYTGRVLLEKPILDRSGPLPNLPFESIAIGYNMRFHPAVRSLRDAQFAASVLPCVAAVAVAVVGQDPFDCDAALGEPGHGTVQERDAVDGVFRAGEL